MSYCSVAIFHLFDELAIPDNGFTVACGNEFIERRLIARKIERWKPVAGFISLTLRPDLLRVNYLSIDDFLVDEINSFTRDRRVLESDRDRIGIRVGTIEGDDNFARTRSELQTLTRRLEGRGCERQSNRIKFG